jgi:hypothetical protein
MVLVQILLRLLYSNCIRIQPLPREGVLCVPTITHTTRQRKMLFTFLVSLLLVSGNVFAFNFPFESIQLQRSDIGNNSDINFGNGTSTEHPRCKRFPDYQGWPSAGRWSAFNASLGSALLRAIPPAAACYAGEFSDASSCNVVRRGQYSVLFAYV